MYAFRKPLRQTPNQFILYNLFKNWKNSFDIYVINLLSPSFYLQTNIKVTWTQGLCELFSSLFLCCGLFRHKWSLFHSWLITGFVTRLAPQVPLVEQELLTLPSSSPVFSEVHVTRSLVLYECFVDRCLSFCPFSFGHCVVCSSSMYGIWVITPLVFSNSSFLLGEILNPFLLVIWYKFPEFNF